MQMDFATEHRAMLTAAALFDLVNAEGFNSQEECSRACRAVFEEVLHRHPDMDPKIIVFAQGLALGRWQARRECGCVKPAKPDKTKS
jgi:hypothetical protein